MTHRCIGNPESLTARLQLALQDRDEHARQRVRDEIGGCATCWEAVCVWSLSLLAGSVGISSSSHAGSERVSVTS